MRRAIKGFNHCLPWCVKYMALGPPVATKPSGFAVGFCGDRSPSCHVFHTPRPSMIKTYSIYPSMLQYASRFLYWPWGDHRLSNCCRATLTNMSKWIPRSHWTHNTSKINILQQVQFILIIRWGWVIKQWHELYVCYLYVCMYFRQWWDY